MVKKTYLAILAVFAVGLTGTVAFADVPAHVDLPDQAERAAAFQPHVVRSNGLVATFVPAMTIFGVQSEFLHPESEGSALLEISSSTSRWGCSGTLIAPNKILTAAHCVANSIGIVDATSGTAYFGNVKDTTGNWDFSADYEYQIVDFTKHKNFDGRYWKGYDLAIVTIETNAHVDIPRIPIDADDVDTVGQNVDIYGYGISGSGDDGATSPFGTHRTGQNTIDAYGDLLYDYIGMKANKDYKRGAVLHSDFDNGFDANDGFQFILGSEYAHPGLGLNKEAKVCSGDSGGSIRNASGEVTGVNSYTLHVENEDTGESSDIDTTKLNCSFGEFTGYMNVPYHEEWINSQLAGGGDDGPINDPPTLTEFTTTIDFGIKTKGPNNDLKIIVSLDKKVSGIPVQVNLSRPSVNNDSGNSWNLSSGVTDKNGEISWSLGRAFTDVCYTAVITNADDFTNQSELQDGALIDSITREIINPCPVS